MAINGAIDSQRMELSLSKYIPFGTPVCSIAYILYLYGRSWEKPKLHKQIKRE